MNKKANKKDRHSQESLLGISLLYIVKQIGKIPHLIKDRKEGDPRYQHSGMTASFGFTLIELLVVVLIIGILAAVALPQYQKAVLKSRLATVKDLTSSLAQAEEMYYLANNSYTKYFDELDIDAPQGTETSVENTYSLRKFSWGRCLLQTDTNPYAQCDITLGGNSYSNVVISFRKFYQHSLSGSKFQCLAGNKQTALANEICKNETGKSTPSNTDVWDY